jgi:hypothetical protein
MGIEQLQDVDAPLMTGCLHIGLTQADAAKAGVQVSGAAPPKAPLISTG